MNDPEDFTGTRPVAPQHAVDAGALGDWLASHIEGFAGPLTLASFKGGQSNPTFKLSTPNATYVLRTKPAPKALLLPSAHAIEREFRVMQGLHGTGVPVPRMLGLCEDESGI
jgi:aminoglycoside phosphotransferase (APT) family kinase protein